MAAASYAASAMTQAESDPTRWNVRDAQEGVDISENGLEIRQTPPPHPARNADRESDVLAVRADVPFLPRRGICYFEVIIVPRLTE